MQWKRVNARGGAPADRACFDYHVGLGPGPCVGAIGREEYAEHVRRVAAFLDGRARRRRGRSSSADARCRGRPRLRARGARTATRLEAVRSRIRGKQKVVSEPPAGPGRRRGLSRGDHRRRAPVPGARGRMHRRQRVRPRQGLRRPDARARRRLPPAATTPRPRTCRARCCFPSCPRTPMRCEAWLSELPREGASLGVPRRGEKERISRDGRGQRAPRAGCASRFRTRYDEERINSALLQLERHCRCPHRPCGSSATTSRPSTGSFTVGSMVVFANGRADSSGVPSVQGPAGHAARPTTSR